jgi:hypothetical protein
MVLPTEVLRLEPRPPSGSRWRSNSRGIYCKNGHEMNNIVKAAAANTITAKLNLLIRRSYA